jgi:putative endonuclease
VARSLREHDGVAAFVYLLRCADGSLYCGWTTDPERRLRQHQAGTASRYTKRRRPVEYALVYAVADRSAALKEEWRIKQLPRSGKLALVSARVSADLGKGDLVCTSESER